MILEPRKIKSDTVSTLIWGIGKDPQIGAFPAGPGAQDLPVNAWDVGLIPGRGTTVPLAVEQLSPGTWRILEPQQKIPCDLTRP